MNAKLKLTGLLIMSILMVRCNQKITPDNFDYGHVEQGNYTNSFFGLTLSIPDDWVVQTKEQTKNIAKIGKDLVAGEDDNLRALIDASEVNSANLLAVFQYEVGAAVEYNPGFMLYAENLKNTPGIKTGFDYLFHTRKLLEQSQVQYSHIDNEYKKERVNNQEFYTMDCSIDYMGVHINQKYYATVINGFCLGAIISFANDEQKSNLEGIINSMNFKP